MQNGINVISLSAYAGENQILKNVTFEVKPGITAIVGSNGSGKSTLLTCINRTFEDKAGTSVTGKVLLNGDDLYAPGQDPTLIRQNLVCLIRQNGAPFPHMSILDNVTIALRLSNGSGEATDFYPRAEEILQQVGLWDDVRNRLNEKPSILSGGQRQRLCIARALANPNRKAYLFDESFSALDPEVSKVVVQVIQKLGESYPVMLVTHDLRLAGKVSDHIAVMLKGELVEFGITDSVMKILESKEMKYLVKKTIT